jgi:hypothetical protein
MIKVEHNTLVLGPSHSKEDHLAVNTFIEYKIEETKSDILRAVREIEAQSHKTRTPIYQDTLFELVYNKINSL